MRLERESFPSQIEALPKPDENGIFVLNGTELKPRQLEILKLTARGMTCRQISKAMYLAPGTIKSYLSNTYRVLGVNNAPEAVATVGIFLGKSSKNGHATSQPEDRSH